MPLDDTDTDDLRAVIEAAAKDTPDVEVPDVESPDIGTAAEVVAAAPASAAPIPDKSDHPTDEKRYADGTFKPTKTEAAPEKAAPETVSPSVDTQAKASVPAPQPDAPPAGWTAAEKAEWSKLPPAIQTAVSRREAEMSRGGQQWSAEKRQYEQILSPLAQETARLGIPVGEGLNTLLAAHHALNQNPVEAIKHLARQYNVDLATIAGQPVSDAPQGQDISGLVRQSVTHHPVVTQMQRWMETQENQRQQATVDAVTAFATSPGHEHFETIQSELMAMIPTIKSMNPGWSHEKILQDAYDRAVFANPTTRQLTLAARDAKAEEDRRKAAAEHAKKARTASVSVTGSPSGTPAAHVPDTIRGALEQAWSGSA